MLLYTCKKVILNGIIQSSCSYTSSIFLRHIGNDTIHSTSNAKMPEMSLLAISNNKTLSYCSFLAGDSMDKESNDMCSYIKGCAHYSKVMNALKAAQLKAEPVMWLGMIPNS